MMRGRTLWIAVPFAIAASQAWRFGDRLPERMATHFDGAGRPNGWMSRDSFFLFYFGMLGFMSLVFFGTGALMRRLRPRFINLPNRDYWLAPERRESTIAEVATSTARFGQMVLLFIVAVHELVLRANVTGENLPTTPLWIGLAGFLTFTAVWAVRFYRRFRLPAA